MTSPLLRQPASVRYDHIDSLRGIAVLLVIWLHVAEVFKRIPSVRENGDWLYLSAKLLDPGRIGVVIFFAISGFVICSSLRGPQRGTSWEFLVKRICRLYPAYWIAIFIGSFAVWQNYGGTLSLGLYLANLTMIPTLFGVKNMMGLLWTLETELVFYILCLLLFWLRLLHKPLALTLTCLLLLLLFGCFSLQLLPAPRLMAWHSMPYHLAIMLWGGIARQYYDNRQTTISFGRTAIKLSALLYATAAMILVPLVLAAIWQWQQNDSFRELTLAAAYTLGMAIFFAGAFRFALRHRLFVWLGTISYSVYLFHPIVFTPIYLWARKNQEHPLAQLHMGVYLAITVLLAIGVSYLVYRFIEAPSNRLARRLVARYKNTTGSHSNV